ncbi:MAG: hypothetical protein KDA65_10240 [Planctomycetaceae bacterium]|nr:hypothetical protein [Planctomycetaceae bacterium]
MKIVLLTGLVFLFSLGIYSWVQSSRKAALLKKYQEDNGIYFSHDYPDWVFEYGLDVFVPETSFLSFEVVTFKSDEEVEEFGQYFDFAKVKMLSFDGEEVTNKSIGYLKNLNSVSMMDITSTQINDEGFQKLPPMPELVAIWLFNVQMSDDALKGLEQFPKLEEVSFFEVKLTDTGISNLRNCKSLGSFTFDRVPLTEKGVLALAELPELVDLNLSHLEADRISSQTFQAICQHQELASLTLDLDFDKENLTLLTDLPNFNSLSLPDMELTDDDLATFSPLANLENLELRGKTITSKGLGPLLLSSQLFSLGLREVPLTSEIIELLKEKKNLQILTIEGGILDRETAQAMNGLKAEWLTLYFEKMNIEPGALEALLSEKLFSDLQFQEIPLTVSDLETLRFLPENSSLSLTDMEITPEHLEVIKHLKQLAFLSLSSDSLSEQTEQELKTALPNCQIYINLD